MNQHEWVYSCYAYYLENYIEPGNPEDGEWQDCHWPVPKCKGGTKTILLLKEHHAVHGVLQSEEWQTPCIWGWEKAYLTGDLLSLCKKWHANLARTANTILTPEKRSANARKGHAKRTVEQRRSAMAAANKANHKPVCITYPDGSVTVTESVKSAANLLGVPYRRVQKILHRENKYLYARAGRNSPHTGIRIEYA